MPVPKAVLTMAVPTIVGQLIVLIYNMADTFFVGRTGNPFMVAGASLILPIFNISLALSSLVGIGGGALISRLLGIQKEDEAQSVFSFSVWLGVAVSAAFALLVLIFMKPLLNLLGATKDTFDFARQYATCVIVFGAIPTVLSNTLANLLRSTGESKAAGFGITMGGLINIGLDPLLMFVIMPKGMEIIGAGVATFISNCIACAYFIVKIIRQKNPVLKMGSPFKTPAKSNIKGVLSVGFPSSLNNLMFDLDYIILNRLMSGYGDFALAALGIVLKAERLPLNVGIGICQGMMPIVAYNYSAGNKKRMDETKHFSLFLGLGVAALSITLYEIFASQIIHFFINEATTVAYGTKFLRMRCLATPFMFLCFFHVFIFNGFGQGKYSLFIGIIRWCVLNIPMLFLLNRLLGINGLALSQFSADCLAVAVSVLAYSHYKRKYLKKIRGAYEQRKRSQVGKNVS